jgi:hypothetical protein
MINIKTLMNINDIEKTINYNYNQLLSIIPFNDLYDYVNIYDKSDINLLLWFMKNDEDKVIPYIDMYGDYFSDDYIKIKHKRRKYITVIYQPNGSKILKSNRIKIGSSHMAIPIYTEYLIEKNIDVGIINDYINNKFIVNTETKKYVESFYGKMLLIRMINIYNNHKKIHLIYKFIDKCKYKYIKSNIDLLKFTTIQKKTGVYLKLLDTFGLCLKCPRLIIHEILIDIGTTKLHPPSNVLNSILKIFGIILLPPCYELINDINNCF